MYAIVDIETSGHSSKITEISIFIFDGKKVIDEYTTLVNPECVIPPFITNLTGITNAMVGSAPKFYEIAKKIEEITADTIFVAHNVNFDYNIIQQEFKDLGFEFKRKKLCTVRLSRKLIPGLSSYSLGSLCATQNIVINDRHRAKGDAEATTILFEKLIKLDKNEEVFNSFLNPRSRQATLPPLLSKKTVDELSEKTGVYYFKNEKNEIIYVGKANNIKQRVLSHFYDKSKKEVTMCLETAQVTFTETGSELVALLLESAEIKKIFPKFNRAQRRAQESVGLFSYEDRNGIIHLAFNKLKLIPNPLMKFHNTTEVRSFLEKLCEEYNLCPKYCHLQSKLDNCFHYQIKECRGVCSDKETVENYNERVIEAIQSFQFETENFVIKEAGRTSNENAYILIINGIYKGFGYENNKKTLTSATDYLKVIDEQKDNNDVKRILNSYLKKNSKTVKHISIEDLEPQTFNLFSY
ncbi:DNA polymerase III subunit epsilon [Lutibacter sp. HS1-25]|uniref:exonuclease domain-containing protein n=1 Tax=Lutibacter sp. HS1-25 TaxID=2485000 RepID=UPI001013970C|nr:exonuclease domain-containing protein [Lutibacter sp. HS1-25]RXP55782.1 DNA polymerase III subunit epsilon [Lutibacter sp. HS1-25]